MDLGRIRRGTLRIFGRVLLCAAAIAGGAALARAMPPARGRVHATSARTTHSVHTATHTARVGDKPSARVAVEAPTVAVPEVVKPHDAFGTDFARGLTIMGTTPNRMILFTFDDGPSRATTPQLLDRLDAAGVHAVFFLSGSRMAGENKQQRDQQEIAHDIVRRGHIVANHTVSHLPLPTLESSEVIAQVDGNQAILERVLDERPWLFRPPFGVHTQRTDALIQDRGYTIMLWNLGTGDFQVRTAQDVHTTWTRVFARREREDGDRGGVILLHDTHAWSVEAFTLIYNDLMARNCKLLEDGEELFDIVDDPSFFFVPRGDAAAGELAPPAVMPPDVLAARQARLREETQQRCTAVAAR